MTLKRNMDIWKRWMLMFQWDVDGEVKNETFYFDTKEAMIEFTKQDGIRITKMFYLEDVEFQNCNLFGNKNMSYEKEAKEFMEKHLLTDDDITENILEQMDKGEGIIITTDSGTIIDIDASWAECDGYEDCWTVRVYKSYEQYINCGYVDLYDSIPMKDFTIGHIQNYMAY